MNRLASCVTWRRFSFGSNPHVSGLIGPLPLALAPFALRRLSRPTARVGGHAGCAVRSAVRHPCRRCASARRCCRSWRSPPRWAVTPSGVARGPRRAASWVWPSLLLALHHGAALAARYGPRLAALRHPAAYERRMFPDQIALREVVSRGRARGRDSDGRGALDAQARVRAAVGAQRRALLPGSAREARRRGIRRAEDAAGPGARPARAARRSLAGPRRATAPSPTTGAWGTPSWMRGCARGAPRCGPIRIRREPAAIAAGCSWIWCSRTRARQPS